jgi:lipid-A-disaccharide synthase
VLITRVNPAFLPYIVKKFTAIIRIKGFRETQIKFFQFQNIRRKNGILMANNKIFVSAGDLSGDIHAANVIKEIKSINQNCQILALGGSNLKRVSDYFIEDIVNINAFGLISLKQILYFKKLLKKLNFIFSTQRPDKVILVDYYGFHIHVARLAKKLNIPVFYYISPQVWASRSSRINKLAKVVKKMLVILPFEEALYRKNGIDAVFVGNPLIDKITQKNNFNQNAFDSSNPPLIGLFPGSRNWAIKRHIPILLETAKILKEKINAKFIIFCANSNFCDLPEYIKVDSSGSFEQRKLIDFAICPSGTVSLENALMGIPMAIIYKLPYISYFFLRAIIKVKYITMVNILSSKNVVSEFIQFNANPKKISGCVLAQLDSKNYMPKVQELLLFRKMLGQIGVSKRVAEIILNA